MIDTVASKIFEIVDWDYGIPQIVEDSQHYFLLIIKDNKSENTIELVIPSENALKVILNNADSYRVSELIGRKLILSNLPDKLGQSIDIKILK